MSETVISTTCRELNLKFNPLNRVRKLSVKLPQSYPTYSISTLESAIPKPLPNVSCTPSSSQSQLKPSLYLINRQKVSYVPQSRIYETLNNTIALTNIEFISNLSLSKKKPVSLKPRKLFREPSNKLIFTQDLKLDCQKIKLLSAEKCIKVSRIIRKSSTHFLRAQTSKINMVISQDNR